MCIITLEKHLLDVQHYSLQHKYTRIDGGANLLKYLFSFPLLTNTQEPIGSVRQDNQKKHQCK